MMRAPDFFTSKQKMSFYNNEKLKMEVSIERLINTRDKLPEHTIGDKTHIELIELRMELTSARKLREQYRAAERRLESKLKLQ